MIGKNTERVINTLFGVAITACFLSYIAFAENNDDTSNDSNSSTLTKQELKEIEHREIRELLELAKENTKTKEEVERRYDSMVAEGPDGVKSFKEAMYEIRHDKEVKFAPATLKP